MLGSTKINRWIAQRLWYVVDAWFHVGWHVTRGRCNAMKSGVWNRLLAAADFYSQPPSAAHRKERRDVTLWIRRRH